MTPRFLVEAAGETDLEVKMLNNDKLDLPFMTQKPGFYSGGIQKERLYV